MDININVKNTKKGREFNVTQINIPEEHFEEAFKNIGKNIKNKLEELSFGEIIAKISQMEMAIKWSNNLKIDRIILGEGAFRDLEKLALSSRTGVHLTSGMLGECAMLCGHPVELNPDRLPYHVGFEVTIDD